MLNEKAKILDCVQGSSQWRAERNGKVTSTLSYRIRNGGTESAWRSFCGLEGEDLRRGHIVEPQIREYMMGVLLTNKIDNPTVTDGVFLASLDGITQDGKTILEIKCPRNAGMETYKDALQGEVPENHYMQMQHAMMVSGALQGKYVVGLAKTIPTEDKNDYELIPDSIIIIGVPRCEEMIGKIKSAGEQFVLDGKIGDWENA